MKKYLSQQFGNPTGVGGRFSTLIMNIINHRMYSRCRQEIAACCTEGNLLDIGFGNGFMLEKLIGNTSCHLYGIDISPDMVALANKKLAQRAQLKVGDVCNLEYEDRFFDAVYTINTFYFWNPTDMALKEIWRVLREGGEFLNFIYTKEKLDKIFFTNVGFKKISTLQIVEMHKDAGFSKVEIVEIVKNDSFYLRCRK